MSTTPKAVTPFGGMVSFFAWLGAIGYGERITAAMPFSYRSPNAIPLEHTLTAFLSSVLVGASRFAHAGWLRHDKALHAMLGIARFPGEDAIRGFFHQFTQARIEAFWRPLWIWLLGLLAEPAGSFTLDMDCLGFASPCGLPVAGYLHSVPVPPSSTGKAASKGRPRDTTRDALGARVTTRFWQCSQKCPLFFTHGCAAATRRRVAESWRSSPRRSLCCQGAGSCAA